MASPICVVTVIAVTIANLRGVRESGKLFTLPTYWFIASLGTLVLAGGYRILTGTVQPYPTEELQVTEAIDPSPARLLLGLRHAHRDRGGE